MERIFILESKDEKQILALIAIITINGAIMLVGNLTNPLRLTIGIATISIAIVFFVFTQLSYSSKSKFSKKLIVNDDFISFQQNRMEKPTTLLWNSIDSIKTGNYEITFVCDNKSHIVSYDTSKEKSIEIKLLLKEIAITKSIRILE